MERNKVRGEIHFCLKENNLIDLTHLIYCSLKAHNVILNKTDIMLVCSCDKSNRGQPISQTPHLRKDGIYQHTALSLWVIGPVQ